MTNDLITRAENAQHWHELPAHGKLLLRELVAALKAAQAEVEQLQADLPRRIVAVPDQMEDRSGVAEADSQNLCGYLSTIAAARSLAAALLAAANAAEATL